MPARKPFLLRMDPEVFEALQRWAADDLRSLNGQIEFVLRDALRARQRLAANRGAEGGGQDDPRGPSSSHG